MGLKGGDCSRKAQVKINVRIHWERFMQIEKPVKFQRACRMN